jgi:hypothetical protein
MKPSGTSEKLNLGYRHGVEVLGGLICGCLLSLGNDNAGNCESKVMSRNDLDEEKMGLRSVEARVKPRCLTWAR